MTPVTDFCFPLKEIESSRVRLVQFDLAKHGQAFVDGVKDHPHLYDYMPSGPFANTDQLAEFLDQVMYSTPTRTCFAIMVKSVIPGEEDKLAGMVGYLNASDYNLVVEIGFITILPEYQGTFVTKNATGLLLMYALDEPPFGLGLRRCVWQCHALNAASKRFAEKMLFTLEGLHRFERVMPIGKQGNGFDVKDRPNVLGREVGSSRDTYVFAHYCDEWERKRVQVLEVMEK